VFVCLDGGDAGWREGLAMTHALAGRRGRVVVCMRESSPFAGILAVRGGLLDDVMGQLSVFGVIQEACVPAHIRADLTEQLARVIHRHYVAMEAAKGNTEADNPSMAPWERLPETLRQSSIAQARHVGVRLTAIGATVIPRSAAAPEFTFTPPEIDLLARMEHDRWKQERAADGWRHGEQRDNARKLHPDMVDWADLSDEAQDKDRDVITSLPATLLEGGFQILRLPQGEPA
jgi:hypothetical protein